MRSAREVEQFASQLAEDDKTPDEAVNYYVGCYEACVPKKFWDVSSEKISHNKAVFNKIVLKYCSHRRKAMRNGWGLIFTGDNGVGKTMFMSFILTQMIKRGCSVYYTTIAGLDKDIKSGFNDPEAARRLDWLLDSNFIAIDELGKEHFKADSFLNMRLEQLLKQRCDDNDPVLLASNLSYNVLCEVYGPSMSSIFDGQYAKASMQPSDFRKIVAENMKRDLGFE